MGHEGVAKPEREAKVKSLRLFLRSRQELSAPASEACAKE